jgi:uncharacterized membrane protein YczE
VYLALGLLVRVGLLVAGLFCFALGVVLNLQSNTGLAPWNAFHFGIHLQTGITLGEASVGVGLAMIGVSWLMGVRPGLGTVANMTLVGYFTDRILDSGVVRPQHELVGQLLMLAAGVSVLAVGTAIYIRPALGAGPRDSFMLALTRRLGWKVGAVRAAIEAAVLVAGWALGGPIGVGTLVFVFGIGPAIQLAFRLFRIRSERPTPAAESVGAGS